jgi:hypothetical protein
VLMAMRDGPDRPAMRLALVAVEVQGGVARVAQPPWRGGVEDCAAAALSAVQTCGGGAAKSAIPVDRGPRLLRLRALGRAVRVVPCAAGCRRPGTGTLRR